MMEGQYFMVCAAVTLSVSASQIRRVGEMSIKLFNRDRAPDVEYVVQMIEDTVDGLNVDATIVVEKGDLYNQPEWLSKSMFLQDFKYPESLSERLGIEIAHHVSLSSRRLLIRELGIE